MIAAFTGLAAACVGSEGGRAATQKADQSTKPPQESSAQHVDFDTIPAAVYQVFDTTVDSQLPRKMTIRLVVLQPIAGLMVTRTLQQVLDSVAKADTTLAAARAILYTGQPSGPRRMRLQPTAYAEWLPPEGWDSAGTGHGHEVHRTYVYRGGPPWAAPPASGANRGGSHD